eukprot:4749908-Prymnesium_polylepis.1
MVPLPIRQPGNQAIRQSAGSVAHLQLPDGDGAVAIIVVPVEHGARVRLQRRHRPRPARFVLRGI